jgi:hypothetical protein
MIHTIIQKLSQIYKNLELERFCNINHFVTFKLVFRFLWLLITLSTLCRPFKIQILRVSCISHLGMVLLALYIKIPCPITSSTLHGWLSGILIWATAQHCGASSYQQLSLPRYTEFMLHKVIPSSTLSLKST